MTRDNVLLYNWHLLGVKNQSTPTKQDFGTPGGSFQNLRLASTISRVNYKKRLAKATFFVSCEEKDYHRIVSVGQFGFDCCPHSRRNGRIHG